VLALLPFLALFLVIPLLAPYNDNLFDDQGGYVGLAKYLVHGHYLSGRDNLVSGGPDYPNLWFGPGLPVILVPFVAAHVPIDVVRLLGPVLLFAAVVAFLHLLRLFVSPRAALAGAGAFALYLPLYTVIVYLHSEVLALLLVVVGLYGIVRYLREGRARFLALGGGALAWLALTRVEFGWIVTLLLAGYALAWLMRRTQRLRRLAAVHALALALCVPWLAYTYSVTGSVFSWGNSGPLSVYWISSPYPGDRGDWHRADWVFSDPNLAPHRPFFRTLVPLDLNAQNRRLEHEAFANIRHKPLKFAENVADNVSRMLFNVPYSFKPAKRSGLVYSLPAGVLLAALVLAGARSARSQRRLPEETVAFAALAAVAFALHAVIAGYPRLLFPLVPIAIWFVAVSWSRARTEVVDA
jgi:hypothetical protein